jgi:class 3 adenylate cyclase
MAKAAGGDVLVSETVKDIVAGSGLRFEDRGTHELRGIEDPRRLFAIV